MNTDQISKPNGLCFSPDYKKLYIADSGSINPRVTYEYLLSEDGKSINDGKIFIDTKMTGQMELDVILMEIFGAQLKKRNKFNICL